jgi:2-polyprenyl-3-methyl-5-hydroxy-6-metoxy-1,4-benzoquinol methylase
MSEAQNEFQSCKNCGGAFRDVNPLFHLVECVDCKLVFCKQIFSQDEFVETYDRLYNNSNSYQKHQKEYDDLKNGRKVSIGYPKKVVMDFLFKNQIKSYTEIGAGIGLVAKYIHNHGLNYFGLELDQSSVEKAKALNLPVVQGDFSLLESLEFKTEAVVAFEVMEHIQDLESYLKFIFLHLIPGGYYGFSVPNYDKIKNYKNRETKIFQSPPPIHLNFFTKSSLKNLAENHGFEIVLLKEKKTPYFNYNRFDTYKFLFKALMGKYYGPTLMCVFKKKDGVTD